MKKSILTLTLLTILSTSSLAADYKAGDIVIRAGATNVNPDSNSSTIYAADQMVNLGGGAISASVDDNTQLGLNLVYFLDHHWAIELLASTPFEHDIMVDTGVGITNLGKTKQLPPTLSALYYFSSNSAFKPYVGVGVNYTIFFDDKFNSTMQGDNSPQIISISDGSTVTPIGAALDADDLDLDSSWGLSAELGADYIIDDNWSVNASVRYIDIDTDASFTAVGGSVPGKVSVDIDPIVYSLLLGYKF